MGLDPPSVAVGGARRSTDLVKFMDILLCSPLGDVIDMSMVMRLVAWVDKGIVREVWLMVGRLRICDLPPDRVFLGV